MQRARGFQRKARFADENSDDLVAWRIKTWLDRAFALARDISTLAPSTIKTRQRKLERDLDAILAEPAACSLAAELQAQFARAREQLLTFCDFPSMVEATNNACERDLRPAVIQRKVSAGGAHPAGAAGVIQAPTDRSSRDRWLATPGSVVARPIRRRRTRCRRIQRAAPSLVLNRLGKAVLADRNNERWPRLQLWKPDRDSQYRYAIRHQLSVPSCSAHPLDGLADFR
ncbi:transposase [Methylocystis sp. MJC1]|uniref:IS66 family transposase n=1 Tax=Methylocystis sp. MJC1 TaxID=2654282 RepID=UPI0013ECC369|nr:transposase [Methylocystis sp. MJC1]KAF2990049.1 hypothetical protein MJC1_02966 [Methylocystis sp. MJC1]MBU6528751.1 transposase [Methylocystis sp. MJC1]UZX11637.1 transposase [Methylocystis sp. MJC1]